MQFYCIYSGSYFSWTVILGIICLYRYCRFSCLYRFSAQSWNGILPQESILSGFGSEAAAA